MADTTAEQSGKGKLYFLLLATIVLTLFLLGVGNVVTRTGSGLGCSDHWPTCNGQWIPDLTNIHVVLEFGHRVAAALVGFFTLFLTIGIWRTAPPGKRRMIRNLSLAAILLLAVQIVLGGVAVKTELSPLVVVVHNATSLLFFATLVGILGRYHLHRAFLDSTGETREHSSVPAGIAGLLFVQMVLGALVRHMGARFGCPDIPLCHGGWLPPAQQEAVIHYSHRLLAVLISLVIVWFAVAALRKGQRLSSRIGGVAVIAVLLQIGFGVMSVLSERIVLWSTFHLLTGTVLLSLFVYLAARHSFSFFPEPGPRSSRTEQPVS